MPHLRLKTVPLAVIGAALVAVAALPAQTGKLSGAADPARVAAGTYTADPAHTLIGWRVSHMGFNDYFGLFGSITGSLTIDPARPEAASVTITVPVRKVTTADRILTSRLLQPRISGKPDYFGPEPKDATFVSTRVVPGADGKTATIEGNLTLNGATRPVSIAATFAGAGKNPYTGKATVGFHGLTKIKRSDFGLTADMTLVGDEVELTITAAFEKR
ncbi:MAG TPA: YceI family protein [Novosphingobium sp.]|nr:YceI family protein [Novosphingobium sp.]